MSAPYRTRPAFQVNAFTRQLTGGNPAGVVLDADGLSDEQMRRIADSLPAHDTAFVFQPTEAGHDVLLRFLTPRREAPFIGHATLAAHYVLAKRGGSDKRKLRQQCGIGTVQIELIKDGSEDYRVAITQ